MRRKIEIKLIEDKPKRHTTFTKRRQGLMKKAEQLCEKSNSQAVVIAFSGSGNCYCLGHPHADPVLDRYFGESSSATTEPEEEAPPLTEAERRIGDAMKSGRWVDAATGLKVDELDELLAELEESTRRVEALAAESG
ncbi:agamous-like MADS-box protein AGL29 [Salvia hispanica]|uniref:agamous-like MADS-box protein AGL29 n=1 Tax=Salvia hispanica TaxID=49212 RepID=UPI0020097242|nr:agamous-like MADS-box protein AGL29 [Salvia hispanica]